MRILAIDPGEKTGFAVVELSTPAVDTPKVLDTWEWLASPLDDFAKGFLRILREVKPDVVVLEDYRIFASKAKAHIGQPLVTAEILGGLEALSTITIPPVMTVRIPASKKGRWPQARLKSKFPEALNIHSPHLRDAVVLALVYLEEKEGWLP